MTDVYCPLKVELEYLPTYNSVMQQNNVSLIRQFSIKNRTNEPLKKICIHLIPEPSFCQPGSFTVETIQPGESIRIENISIKPSPRILIGLKEQLAVTFRIRIECEEKEIWNRSYPLTLLTYEHWSGSAILPEMLVGFVTPNNPAVSILLEKAALLLGESTGNPLFDHYQTHDINRVKQQIAAIYEVLSQEEILYDTEFINFNEPQEIRNVDSILNDKKANSLEISLLFAACMEAVKLHPLIFINDGQAFAGAWLVQETFPDNLVDDSTYFTQRVAEGVDEVLMVQVKGMYKEQFLPFEEAVIQGTELLMEDEDFLYALAVKRTRLNGIRPLAQRIRKDDEWIIIEDETYARQEPPPLSFELIPVNGVAQDSQASKQMFWERKLLDLSLRNNLLNLRVTKNTLRLASFDLACFEDALADGREFRILSVTDTHKPLPALEEFNVVEEKQRMKLALENELENHRLRSSLPEEELKKALQHLYRSSRLSMEENGANTLYLALGFLKWFETTSSIKPRYAPILLLPVEIIRKSSAGGFVIRSREEETLLNITLLEMLRQNYGITVSGLDPLPADDSGVNVNLIYSIFRENIQEQPHWEVEEEAVLGIFSFNKFIMWNDLHNNADKLVRNQLVSSLMNGMLKWEADDMLADASVLDRELTPADILLPISADSSQLESIFEAVEGKSFILHGPPGTGKSQTITNIIVNALYRGKRVLFVAEKMAALSVVQSRLAALGLDPFCLELHSNKTKKSAVMEQIKKTTEIIRYKSPAQFAAEAERLHGLRSELNTYIDGLHTLHPFGLSLYDAIVRYLSLEKSKEVPFPAGFPETMTNEVWQDLEELVLEIINIGNTFGHPAEHPLRGITFSTYSQALKEDAAKLLQETIALIITLKEKLPRFHSLLGETDSFRTRRQLELTAQFLELLVTIPELTAALLLKPALPDVIDEFKDVVTYGVERDRLRKEIAPTFDETVLQIPSSLWLNNWKQAEQKWFIPRFFGQRKVYKELKKYSVRGKIEKETVPGWLDLIQQAQAKEKQIEEYRAELIACFGRIARAGKEDWEKIEKSLEQTQILHDLILLYGGTMEGATLIKQKLAGHLTQGIRSFRDIYATFLQELTAHLKEFADYNCQLETVLGANINKLYETGADRINYALTCLNRWHDNLHRLKDWYQWLRVYEKVQEKEITFFADAYVEQNLPTVDLLPIFRKSYWKICIQYIFTCCPELELFNGALFETVIQRYRELSNEFENLTRRELYSRLASNIPYFTQEASRNSEVGILQKNIRNNARGMSIRRLFDLIPTLLQRLSPCMLMSPISVAQYIDPDAEPFDLIIFDEASQMPTYEAVGAMARGKHVVIVGDPKQMPPTSFFMSNTVDEENIEMEDLESILDDCLALSMPSKHLLWHYRSRHESLIAFSNGEYYENKLLTFPSPDNIQSKVSAVPIEGFYDKGKSRQNRQEAEAVVKEIIRRLSDEELRKKSIGVVTFSSVQQILIEDLLSEVLDNSPKLEKYANAASEPIFIKNLENVQGDERDVILFSVGYGPDANGRVSMNFGPLNRNGGERRLNVAVSRARYEMMIFSTLRSDMIDLNRTSSVGVAGLKRFLEYAEKGATTHSRTIGNKEEVSIAGLIAAGVRRLGYTVHTNIGCSGYKIDVGIVDEASPSEYLLGILCDGKNYKSTKTARDREIVQNNVLKQLGWNICRVWTLDWHENQEAVLGAIMQTVEQVKKERTTKEKDVSKTEFKQTFIKPVHEIETEIIKEEETLLSEGITYTSALLLPVSEHPEDFFHTNNRRVVLSQLKNIVQVESPISKTLLAKRVMSLWNISRQTQRFESYMDEMVAKCEFFISTNEELSFLWNNKQQYQEYSTYRIQSDREPADIPPEEIANGVRDILRQQISIPLPDLVKTAGQLFGFARSGPNIDAAMMRGIQEAIRRDYVKLNSGRIVIK